MLDDIKGKADELLHNEKVQGAVEKAKEFINSDKGKEAINNAREKAEDFVEEKTGGKGIFGFGKKE